MGISMRWYAMLLPLVLLTGCAEERRTPPAALLFEGLPVSGSAADSKVAGFTRCATVGRSLRCRREGVMVAGKGPYSAAVDLLYTDGSGGFDQLTVWHDRDQSAVNAVGKLLEAQGWQLCRTGPNENRGDQAVYTKAGAPVRYSIDLSYWGKRRLRILPETNQPTGKCW